MRDLPPQVRNIEQPRIEYIDTAYPLLERKLTEEEIEPFHAEAVSLAEEICTVNFYQYEDLHRSVLSRRYTNTHALSPPVPYKTATGKEIEIGVRFNTHGRVGEDDPHEKVVELGILQKRQNNKGKKELLDHSNFRVRADLRYFMIRAVGHGKLYGYPDNLHHSERYDQNRPQDLEAFMQGVRYIARWLEVPTQSI